MSTRTQHPITDWTVDYRTAPDAAPSASVPAIVPGAVQLDWARAHDFPDPHFADNSKAYGWMEDVWWKYCATLPAMRLDADRRLILCLEGVDYHFEVVLDGEIVHTQEGMFARAEVDVTRFASVGAKLEVRLRPAPKRLDAHRDRAQADTSVKPAVSYGWDWHPRLIPLGIWQEAYFEERPEIHLLEGGVRVRVSDDLSRAQLVPVYRATEESPARWRVYSPDGELLHEVTGSLDELSCVVESPELWWPHDHGKQPLYRSKVELLDRAGVVIDARVARFGIRRVELVMAPGQFDEPRRFPKSRSHAPITLHINGRDVFAKGSNWVNPDIFPGRLTRDAYAKLLTLAKEAHFNLLRVWGGGIVNKEAFFELCDELGLMVWQEFPLACNNYDHRKRPEYLQVLEQEARAIVRRVRNHPSLVIWCGGNELFNGWSGMTDQSLALRLLDKVCYEEDRDTPFLPTSPVDGMAHGHYVFRDAEHGEVHALMNGSRFTAYTEFGCPSVAPVEVLKSIIPANELWPPKPGTAWEHHHAFKAWLPEAWLFGNVIEHYFGESSTLEELVTRSQWLQCEAYKAIYEEARRQKPTCSMALNWCFNEPWPTAANNSLLSFPAIAKPAYFAVRDACRPVMPSARLSKFAWRAGERFDPQLWILNDTYETVRAARVEATLTINDETFTLLTWDHAPVEPNRHLIGPTLAISLPDQPASEMTLTVRMSDGTASSYRLRYHPSERTIASRAMNL